MRGHDAVIKMRLQGFKPASVWIWDMPGYVGSSKWIEDLQMPQIETAGDDLSSIDLRFVVGCEVFVNAESVGRGKRIAAMCQKSEASRVVVFAADKAAVWEKGGTWQNF